MLKRILTSATCVLGFALASNAQAGPMLDFTDASVWGGVAGVSTFNTTQNGLNVTLNSSSGNMSFNSLFDGGAGDPNPCGRLLCDGDGIGVGDDEVTVFAGVGFGESLEVVFNNGPVNLESFDFLDLFGENGGTADDPAEVAQWLINGGSGGSATGTAEDPDTTGWLNVGVATTGVNSITFFANGPISPTNTDFAVAAITTVPVPATLGLLGVGLVGLGVLSRRRKQ